MSNLSIEELQQFSYKLALPAIITLVLSIFGFHTFGLVISIVIHIIVLGVFFLLFKEFKSAFLQLVLVALLMCLVAEVSAFFNLGVISLNEYSTFLMMHFIRNIALGCAFAWNALKSHIFNPIWIKLTPIGFGVVLFIVLQVFIFNYEEADSLNMIIYNASLCFMWFTSGLRYSHTSDRSYVVMIIAMTSFMLSDAFFFWEFMPGHTDSIIAAFRIPLLQLGTCLMIAGTVEHVIHFKMTVKQRIYLPMTEKDNTTLKGKAAAAIPSVTKNILNFSIGKKKLQEPLI